MPKVFTSKTQRKGEIGEHLAVRYLQNKGFSIIDRNYTKKWGEIDIIAKKWGRVHFIEVKSQTVLGIDEENIANSYHPEENMHTNKIARLRRTIQSYLAGHTIKEWQFDLMTVHIDQELREAKVVFQEDVIL